MRRVSRDWYKLAEQLRASGIAILAEPAWPGSAPSQVAVTAAGDEILDLRTQISHTESLLQGLRTQMAAAMDEGTRLMRLVDYVTSGLYGESGPEKANFALRPVDRTRNSPGPTPQVSELALLDGDAVGSISLKWKGVPRATFEIQWFSDEALETLMGAMVATKSQAIIPSLQPGVQVWVRVRALRGGRLGEWSETGTRIANV
jgi:hypothetical protein